MNYYFDVKLNFLSEQYNSFEWDKKDNIMDIRKVPIVKIKFNDFINIYSNKIKVSKELLEKIRNKTIIDNGLIEYAVIFTDGNNSLGVLFNTLGESILYSALTLKDELNIEEVGFKIKKMDIEYSVLESKNIVSGIRFDKDIREYIKKEVSNMVKSKNDSKIIYIYNESFKTSEKCIDKVLKKLASLEGNEYIYVYNVLKSTDTLSINY